MAGQHGMPVGTYLEGSMAGFLEHSRLDVTIVWLPNAVLFHDIKKRLGQFCNCV